MFIKSDFERNNYNLFKQNGFTDARPKGVTGGNPELIETIALSAAATGADGFFIETHPDPKSAKSDPHTMLQIDRLEGILKKTMEIRKALGYE